MSHVLVVEDHELLRESIRQTLSAASYRVSVAESGDEAAVLVESGLKPDAILTDLRMPGKLNGLELARLVRGRHPAVAVLLMTGFADVLRADDYRLLSKPFDPRTLLAAVGEVIAVVSPRPGASRGR